MSAGSDLPRALRDPAAVVRRRQDLGLPHMAALNDLVAGLRAEGRGFVPDFDPADAGRDAQILFLLEKPGPRTDPARGGSGFISRDNDDRTAEAIGDFMRQAGIPRRRTLLWNVVPWWNGRIAIRAAEWHDGVARLGALLELLPRLRLVVAVGRRAERARGVAQDRGLPFCTSAHPSPVNRATRPEVWTAIPVEWAIAARHYAPQAALSRAGPVVAVSSRRSFSAARDTSRRWPDAPAAP